MLRLWIVAAAAVALGFPGGSPSRAASVGASITVSAVVVSRCTVSNDPLGPRAMWRAELSVACTAGTPYSVAMGDRAAVARTATGEAQQTSATIIPATFSASQEPFVATLTY